MSTVTREGILVEVSQGWLDPDKRMNGRKRVVVAIDGDKAVMERCLALVRSVYRSAGCTRAVPAGRSSRSQKIDKENQMAIYFSNVRAVYTPNTTVAFPAKMNGIDLTCEISGEALFDHFGSKSMAGDDMLAAFEASHGLIEAAASAVLPHRAPTGRCLLVSTDF